MKTFTLTLTFALLALFAHTNATPLPQNGADGSGISPIPNGAHSAVILKLKDGRTAHCTIPGQPSRQKADIVSHYLIASGKTSCNKTREHAAGGKTQMCECGQNVTPEEASQLLKTACEKNAGTHSVA